MPWYDSLLDQGYVPGGTTPKTVIEEGGKPGYYQTDPLSNALRSFAGFQQKQQEENERIQKQMDKKIDMYKTLRDSGYDPQRAYDAVHKLKFPGEPGGETSKDLEAKKTKAEITKIEAETDYIPIKNAPKLQNKILQKMANGEDLTNGEQRIYDETIKKKKDNDLESTLSGKDKETHIATREKILGKIANGEALTPGEQQLYDDIFAKTSDLSKVTKKTEKTNNATEYIPMLKPDGTPTRVHKDDVVKALKKGYKRR